MTKVINISDKLKKYALHAELRKQLDDTAKLGKTAIGCHYALKRLQKIKDRGVGGFIFRSLWLLAEPP